MRRGMRAFKPEAARWLGWCLVMGLCVAAGYVAAVGDLREAYMLVACEPDGKLTSGCGKKTGFAR